jgi:hypothetical protein
MAHHSEGERRADLVSEVLKDVPFDICYSRDLHCVAQSESWHTILV